MYTNKIVLSFLNFTTQSCAVNIISSSTKSCLIVLFFGQLVSEEKTWSIQEQSKFFGKFEQLSKIFISSFRVDYFNGKLSWLKSFRRVIFILLGKMV